MTSSTPARSAAGRSVPGDSPRPGDRNGDRRAGKPFAIALKRSTYGQDGCPSAALKAMTHGRASTRSIQEAPTIRLHLQLGLREQATGVLLVGPAAGTALGQDRCSRRSGTASYEWRGFLSEPQHPHATGGPSGLLLNWNNKPAPGWKPGDDQHLGAVQHVELFGPGRPARGSTTWWA